MQFFNSMDTLILDTFEVTRHARSGAGGARGSGAISGARILRSAGGDPMSGFEGSLSGRQRPDQPAGDHGMQDLLDALRPGRGRRHPPGAARHAVHRPARRLVLPAIARPRRRSSWCAKTPAAPAMAVQAEMARRTALLVADFREVWQRQDARRAAGERRAACARRWGSSRMRAAAGGAGGAVVHEPGPAAGRARTGRRMPPGTKEVVGFPSGDYEFLHNAREMVGPYMACSCSRRWRDFTSQLQAVEVARAVMAALFDAGQPRRDRPGGGNPRPRARRNWRRWRHPRCRSQRCWRRRRGGR